MAPASLYIKNIWIHLENGEIIPGNIYIYKGKINSIVQGFTNGTVEPNTEILDGKKLYAIPGFIDTHIHGSHGADTMDATSESLDLIAESLLKEGTTSFLATTITQSIDQIEKALQNVATYKQQIGKAELIGIHLEGPFIEKSKAGAQPLEHILNPDIKLFKRWQDIAANNIRIVTLAPELDPTGTFIKTLNNMGIIISAGHTKIDFNGLKQATDFGVSQLTHLCNAMNGIHHREIGPIGGALLLKELKAEIIADGIHVAPEMLELIYKQMGSDRIILITDAIRAKGLPNGEYELGGQLVTVSDGKALINDETLAGSVLTMRDAALNMIKFCNAELTDIIKMTAVNPAKQLGIYKQKGSISIGKDADILLVDEELNIKYTICKGMVAKF